MRQQIYSMRFTIVTAMFIGFLISSSQAGLWGIYDNLNPLVRMQGNLVSRDADSVLIHIAGDKLRTCQFVQLDSYATDSIGLVRDANETRVDGQAYDSASKPLGSYDLGMWRIYPLGTNAVSVQMYVEHSCSGRLVIPKIADITL